MATLHGTREIDTRGGHRGGGWGLHAAEVPTVVHGCSGRTGGLGACFMHVQQTLGTAGLPGVRPEGCRRTGELGLTATVLCSSAAWQRVPKLRGTLFRVLDGGSRYSHTLTRVSHTYPVPSGGNVGVTSSTGAPADILYLPAETFYLGVFDGGRERVDGQGGLVGVRALVGWWGCAASRHVLLPGWSWCSCWVASAACELVCLSGPRERGPACAFVRGGSSHLG